MDRSTKRWLRILSAVAVLSLASSATLGYLYLDLERKVTSAEERLEDEVKSSEDRIADQVDQASGDIQALVEQALSQVGQTARVEEDLSQLEQTLFGFSKPLAKRNVIGDIDLSISKLEIKTDSLRSCFNDALWDSFKSYDNATNGYAFTYYVSRC